MTLINKKFIAIINKFCTDFLLIAKSIIHFKNNEFINKSMCEKQARKNDMKKNL